MGGPLEGLRVVELAEGVAGPYCAQELSDAGADVIKVEKPGGDRTRGWGSRKRGDVGVAFLATNRGKRGVALDPASEAGVEVLRKLIAGADIVIADAGWSTDAALEYDSLGELNPQLVYCRFSEYGKAGPWADQPPYGELVAQLAGDGTGSLGAIGQPPVRMATDIASMYAAIYAVMSICAAVYARDESGGQRIDVSLFGSILAMRSTLWVALSNPGRVVGLPPRQLHQASGHRLPLQGRRDLFLAGAHEPRAARGAVPRAGHGVGGGRPAVRAGQHRHRRRGRALLAPRAAGLGARARELQRR